MGNTKLWADQNSHTEPSLRPVVVIPSFGSVLTSLITVLDTFLILAFIPEYSSIVDDEIWLETTLPS
jgi:hypothetical protein